VKEQLTFYIVRSVTFYPTKYLWKSADVTWQYHYDEWWQHLCYVTLLCHYL